MQEPQHWRSQKEVEAWCIHWSGWNKLTLLKCWGRVTLKTKYRRQPLWWQPQQSLNSTIFTVEQIQSSCLKAGCNGQVMCARVIGRVEERGKVDTQTWQKGESRDTVKHQGKSNRLQILTHMQASRCSHTQKKYEEECEGASKSVWQNRVTAGVYLGAEFFEINLLLFQWTCFSMNFSGPLIDTRLHFETYLFYPASFR